MNTTPKTKRTQTHYEWVADHRLGPRYVLIPGDPSRLQKVVGRIVWHAPELAGVLVPAGVAVAVTPWAWLVSGVVAAGWTGYEVWQAREQAAIKAGRDLPAVTDTDDASAADADMDATDTDTVDESTDDGTVAVASAASQEVRL